MQFPVSDSTLSLRSVGDGREGVFFESPSRPTAECACAGSPCWRWGARLPTWKVLSTPLPGSQVPVGRSWGRRLIRWCSALRERRVRQLGNSCWSRYPFSIFRVKCSLWWGGSDCTLFLSEVYWVECYLAVQVKLATGSTCGARTTTNNTSVPFSCFMCKYAGSCNIFNALEIFQPIFKRKQTGV